MADDGDNDPVVASYDVVLNNDLLSSTHADGADSRLVILQYPSFRRQTRPYNARRKQQPRSLRLKPEMGMVEVDVPLLGHKDYNADMGARFGRALAENKTLQAGGSLGLGGGFNSNNAAQYSARPLQAVPAYSDVPEEPPALETLTLGGKMAVPTEQDPVYFLASFRHGALHLSAVKAVVQLRPQLHHLDAEDENASVKRFSQASAAQAANGARASTGIESKAIEIKMKDTKDDARDKGLNEGARLLRNIQAERWQSHEWIDQDDDTARAMRERLDNSDGPRTPLKTSLSNGDWLDRMSAPREDGKKGLLAKLRGRERERARRKKAEEEKRRKSKADGSQTSSNNKAGALMEQSSDTDTSSGDGSDAEDNAADDTDNVIYIKEEGDEPAPGPGAGRSGQ